MIDIITDLSKLEVVSEPLKFIDESGNHEDEGREIISKLKEAFDQDKAIIALAAPQIGIYKRIFGIRFDDKVKFFINPIITKKSGLVISPETFVNLPNKEILIGRPEEVTVVYYTEDFKYEDNKLLGAAAKIFDQMAQLLDGVLPTELGLVSDIVEDGPLSELTEDEIKQVQEIWKKFVKTKLEKLETEINSNEDAKKYYRQLKFTESVINGRTHVIEDQPKLNRAQRRALKKNKGVRK